MMKFRGYTLIELLTTLVLVTILAFWVTTSMSGLRDKNEKLLIVDELKTIIQYSKVQAVITGVPLSLIPLDENMDWSRGAKLIKYTKNKNPTLLYQWQWQHSRWNLQWSGVNVSKEIIFYPKLTNALANGTFVLYNRFTNETINIVLNRMGRIKIKTQI